MITSWRLWSKVRERVHSDVSPFSLSGSYGFLVLPILFQVDAKCLPRVSGECHVSLDGLALKLGVLGRRDWNLQHVGSISAAESHLVLTLLKLVLRSI